MGWGVPSWAVAVEVASYDVAGNSGWMEGVTIVEKEREASNRALRVSPGRFGRMGGQ